MRDVALFEKRFTPSKNLSGMYILVHFCQMMQYFNYWVVLNHYFISLILHVKYMFYCPPFDSQEV